MKEVKKDPIVKILKRDTAGSIHSKNVSSLTLEKQTMC